MGEPRPQAQFGAFSGWKKMLLLGITQTMKVTYVELFKLNFLHISQRQLTKIYLLIY